MMQLSLSARRFASALLILALPSVLPAQTAATPFMSGMVITHSVRIRPGRYLAPAGDSAAITVRGSNIVVDLRGVELIGSSDRENPEGFAGTAVRVDGGRNVTVTGARVRGYKVGIIARGVTRLRLLDNDLSDNWRPRLYSGIEKESLVDWLSYHHNEKDEWLRYGAAIYLVDVSASEVKGNTVRRGMNGLMLVRTTGTRVWNNDFSYNSGLGVGMYRASYDTLMHNHIDYDVRGYSHGFFNRGQDSAGLLMFEQTSNNVVAFNSVTHGGDGLFLWAGQSTMDSGQGGANDNLFYRNDFSHAPTNGMEATFSRNAFVNNRVEENWHGLWGGYSYNSVVIGNAFARNVEAIAIEHGQDNVVGGNSFTQDTTAIHLWWNKIEPSDWGYPKHRDTRSRGYAIEGNEFHNVRLALRADNTQALRGSGNLFRDVDSLARISGDSSGTVPFWQDDDDFDASPIPTEYQVAKLPGGINAILPAGARRGRNTIIVDEWGPYEWKSPKLWPVGRSDATPQKLRVLGPAGRWQVVSRDGVASLSASSGKVGDTLVVTPVAGHENDYRVQLEYRGLATTSPFGEKIAAGTAVRFGWSRYLPTASWHLRFLAWDSVRTPRTDDAAIAQALRDAEITTMDTTRLDLTWYGPPRKIIPQANVLTEATTSVTLAPGKYTMRTISDDAVKVYLDGNLLLDDWAPGESHAKAAEFTATGTHTIRVVHLQIDGWYELRLDIERMK
ncbi:MAG: right-handed parallel beta-helix repeat-containing protein [Gemmatimonadota bacterium]